MHWVLLDAFAIGRTPVTWSDYRHFCEATSNHWPEWLEEGGQYHLETGNNDYYAKCGIAVDKSDLPVVGISWKDAQIYCRWLSAQTGERYALLTEAQWEYACRASTETRWSCGDEPALAGYAWYSANSGGMLQPVAGKHPNSWGLYDMHGNCWEWCADWYAQDYYQQLLRVARKTASGARVDASDHRETASENPRGPKMGTYRVVRGGSFINDAVSCRSAYRLGGGPSLRHLGFRLSRTV